MPCLEVLFVVGGGKTPATIWVEHPRNNSGVAETRQSRMATVHNLLAPLTERFSLRIRTPPRTVPSTAIGMQTPPEEKMPRCQIIPTVCELSIDCSCGQVDSPIIMVEKETVWLNCLSMNLAMKVARPASSAARFTCARTTNR